MPSTFRMFSNMSILPLFMSLLCVKESDVVGYLKTNLDMSHEVMRS